MITESTVPPSVWRPTIAGCADGRLGIGAVEGMQQYLGEDLRLALTAHGRQHVPHAAAIRRHHGHQRVRGTLSRCDYVW